MFASNEFADSGSSLTGLRRRARTLRSLTSDAQLRWDLVEVESLADVMLARGAGLEAHAWRANTAYLTNVLDAIEEKVGALGHI